MRRRETLLLVICAACVGLTTALTEPGSEEKPCARSCHAISCDSVMIRYGRFCGMGHGGCPGVEPCDGVDKCCQRHDSCVMKKGKFLRCLDKHKGQDHLGFAPDKCPYSLVIPTMKEGIELAMSFGNSLKVTEEAQRKAGQQAEL